MQHNEKQRINKHRIAYRKKRVESEYLPEKNNAPVNKILLHKRYPLTPPTVSPSMNALWLNMNRITIGTIDMTEPAKRMS